MPSSRAVDSIRVAISPLIDVKQRKHVDGQDAHLFATSRRLIGLQAAILTSSDLEARDYNLEWRLQRDELLRFRCRASKIRFIQGQERGEIMNESTSNPIEATTPTSFIDEWERGDVMESELLAYRTSRSWRAIDSSEPKMLFYVQGTYILFLRCSRLMSITPRSSKRGEASAAFGSPSQVVLTSAPTSTANNVNILQLRSSSASKSHSQWRTTNKTQRKTSQ